MLSLRAYTGYAAALTGVFLVLAAIPAVGVLAVAAAGDACGLSTCDDHDAYFHTFGTLTMIGAMVTGTMLLMGLVRDHLKPKDGGPA